MSTFMTMKGGCYSTMATNHSQQKIIEEYDPSNKVINNNKPTQDCKTFTVVNVVKGLLVLGFCGVV